MERLHTYLKFQIVGMSLCFTWIFCAFPTVDVNSVLQGSQQYPQQILLRLAIVGIVPGILIPLASRYISISSVRLILVIGGCFLRLLGCYVSLSAFGVDNPFPLLFVGDFLMGVSTSLYLILWGVSLRNYDTESSEKVFISVFVIVGLSILAINGLLSSFMVPLLFVLPVLELACYLFISKGTRVLVRGAVRPYVREGKDFVLLAVRTCIAITLVSFVWEMFATSAQDLIIPEQSIFGMGLVVSALIIWLFTKYSSNVGFIAAAHWVLPIMAIGLLFSSFDQKIPLSIACLLLAGAHASLETILRMQIISFSRKTKYDPIRVIGWGFASIMLGAFLGSALFNVIAPRSTQINTMLIIGILTILVIIGTFMFSDARPEIQVGKQPPADVGQRSARMAASYGLSKREQEILGYLLEGRSHPYIRDELYISKSTVDTHVRHIYSKTGVKSKQELIDVSKES